MGNDSFRTFIRQEGTRLYRDLPWRRTRDPYIIWFSEVMLQQTQVPRVEARMPEWLDRFPTIEALAAASAADVLAAWQGMGYNRRALALHTAARQIVEEHHGVVPRETAALTALPGIGPATAQGIRAFAFDLPGVYLETNVRTVFLHHFFPDVPGVPDRELTALIEAACPAAPGATGDVAPYAMPQDERDTPRAWYYALLDYGAYLKKTIPNPSRRSAVRVLLAARDEGERALALDEITQRLSAREVAAGRDVVTSELVMSILADLERDGFCAHADDAWSIISA